MKTTKRLRTWSVAALAAVILLTFFSFHPHRSTAHMTPLSPRLEPLFTKTKTICFGRMLIDVPETATAAWGDAEMPYSVEIVVGKADDLEKHVQEWEDKMKSEVRSFTSKQKLYDETVDGPLPGQKTVIGQWGFADNWAIRMESLFKLGKDLVWFHGGPPKTSKEKVLGDFYDLGRRIRYRAETDIPTEPGMCFEDGFARDKSTGLPKPGEAWQLIEIGFRLKEFPDTHFSISVTSTAQNPEKETLDGQLSRMDAMPMSVETLKVWNKIKTFRRAKRTDNEVVDGFEVLWRTPKEENSLPHHDFRFRAVGKSNDPVHPSIDVQMQTGVYDNLAGSGKVLLTDDEAIAVWDKLLGSIRLRPTGGAVKTGDAAPTGPAPIQYAMTGDVCPQTGWWTCGDSLPARGGPLRYIALGTTMPHISVAAIPNLWERLTNQDPWTPLTTQWEFVGETAPRGSTTPSSLLTKLDDHDRT